MSPGLLPLLLLQCAVSTPLPVVKRTVPGGGEEEDKGSMVVAHPRKAEEEKRGEKYQDLLRGTKLSPALLNPDTGKTWITVCNIKHGRKTVCDVGA